METVVVAARSDIDAAPTASAVGWGAIIAGAIAAIATNIVLITLGAGIGLTAVSPWSEVGATAKAIGASAIIWLIVSQWISAALGGFLTGRLRVRWNYYDHNEVFFRDTAHGFLSWALATAIVAVFATTLTTGVIGTAANGVVAGAGAASKANESSVGYFTDSLYRSDTVATPPPAADGSSSAVPTTTSPSPSDVRGETSRILARGLMSNVSPDDRTYLAKMVAARTGMSQDDAQKRVDDVITEAKTAADATRKAAASLAIATALSLVIGAFIAAVAAAFGGHERDE